MSKTKTKYLSIRDVAKRMSVVPHTAWNWCVEGKLKFTRDGLNYRITERDFRAMRKRFNSDGWIKKRKVAIEPVTTETPVHKESALEKPQETTISGFTREQVFKFVEDHLGTEAIMAIRSKAEFEAHCPTIIQDYRNYWISDFKRTGYLLDTEDR